MAPPGGQHSVWVRTIMANHPRRSQEPGRPLRKPQRRAQSTTPLGGYTHRAEDAMALETRELKRIAEGREAEIFAWEPGKVLRRLRTDGGHARLETEARAMRIARDAGVPVPAVYDVVTV